MSTVYFWYLCNCLTFLSVARFPLSIEVSWVWYFRSSTWALFGIAIYKTNEIRWCPLLCDTLFGRLWCDTSVKHNSQIFPVAYCYCASGLTLSFFPRPRLGICASPQITVIKTSSLLLFSLLGLCLQVHYAFFQYYHLDPVVAFLFLFVNLSRDPDFSINRPTRVLASTMTRLKYLMPCHQHWNLFHPFFFELINKCSHHPGSSPISACPWYLPLETVGLFVSSSHKFTSISLHTQAKFFTLLILWAAALGAMFSL